MSAHPDSKRSKTEALREEGTLNPAPDKVQDPKFQEGDFFDPHDVVQVRYEMLRRVRVDRKSVTEAAEEYGVSRPTYYQAKGNFEAAGIAGLAPSKPGPRSPHKIGEDVLAFLQEQLVPGEPVRARALAKLVRRDLNIDVHPRTIERAVKKTLR
ncbi:MAG: helix-turn-helix domain containing protein [Rhodobacterales bacterium]|nr:helix-turn-helix domain containing protein [Rhodobacterales bacterium]